MHLKRTRKRAWPRLVCLVGACLLIGAACGDDESDEDAPPIISIPPTTGQPTTSSTSPSSLWQVPSTTTSTTASGFNPSALCFGRGPEVSATPVNGGPWRDAFAGTFYIGEPPSAANGQQDYTRTEWVGPAVEAYGGVDHWGPVNPANRSSDAPKHKREGWCPWGFVVHENPFYVALPTPDHTADGPITAAYEWVARAANYLPELKRFPGGAFQTESPFKNLWVQVKLGDKSVFGQLEDVGPVTKQGRTVADYHFVWGDKTVPTQDFLDSMGIELSPAMTDYLGTNGYAQVKFRFVPASQVPDGPWKVRVTTRVFQAQ